MVKKLKMAQVRSLFVSFGKLTAALEKRISCLIISVRQWQDNSLWPQPALNAPLPVYNDHNTSPQSTLEDCILWAVPKKRTSHSKKRMRMTHKYLKPKHHYCVCPKCNNLKLRHVLCSYCLKKTLRLTALMRREEMNNSVATKD